MDLVTHLCESVFAGDTQPQPGVPEKTESESDGSQKKPTTDFQSFWNYYYAKNESKSHPSDDVAGSHDGTETLKSAETSAANNSFLSDKLMEKVIQMMIPMNVESSEIISQRLAVQSTRPSLSINSMSTNATLLTLRLSYTFQCIDAVTIYFSWREPSYTLAVLLVITHTVLRPELLLAFPCLYLITNVIIPHYLIRHPPDNSLKELLGRNPIPADGEPLRSSSIPKPVPQFSQEFLLNLTDLQNHQLDFVAVYDFVVFFTKDYLYFKDEAVSSLVFILLLSVSFYNAIVLPKVIRLVWKYLPIKMFVIAFVWLSTLAFHPVVKNYILNLIYDEQTRIAVVSNNNRIETYLIRVLFHQEAPTQEAKEAEIFELQKLLAKTSMWEPVGFTDEVYTINNPTRRTTSHLLSTLVEGFECEDKEHDESDEDLDSDSDGEAAVMSHINRCSNLDEIDPPLGWKFDSKWAIDLRPAEWVGNRMIDDVVSVDSDEKWVYDAPIDLSSVYRRRRWVRRCKRETRR